MASRIKCSVENCFYNEKRICEAKEIEVNNDPKINNKVTKSAQTECATFIPK